MENLLSLLKPSEKLRKKFLAEEQRLRKKQPEHWAKTKYRKFANTVKVGAELFGATLITDKPAKASGKGKKRSVKKASVSKVAQKPAGPGKAGKSKRKRR